MATLIGCQLQTQHDSQVFVAVRRHAGVFRINAATYRDCSNGPGKGIFIFYYFRPDYRHAFAGRRERLFTYRRTPWLLKWQSADWDISG
jgi:hypothetical protein